jgi:hypothetical protein
MNTSESELNPSEIQDSAQENIESSETPELESEERREAELSGAYILESGPIGN